MSDDIRAATIADGERVLLADLQRKRDELRDLHATVSKEEARIGRSIALAEGALIAIGSHFRVYRDAPAIGDTLIEIALALADCALRRMPEPPPCESEIAATAHALESEARDE